MNSEPSAKKWDIINHVLDALDDIEAQQPFEYVEIFPGWALRKVTKSGDISEIEACVSGYVALHYPSPAALGKGKTLLFDGLMKVAGTLQKRPPHPETDQTKADIPIDQNHGLYEDYGFDYRPNVSDPPHSRSLRTVPSCSTLLGGPSCEDFHGQPDIIENRLLPFLSRPLPNRDIEISILGPHKKPLVSMIVKTAKDGSFEGHLVVKQEVLEKFPELSNPRKTSIDVIVTIDTDSHSRGETQGQSPAQRHRLSCRTSTCALSDVSAIRVISDVDVTIRDTRAYAGVRTMLQATFLTEHRDVVLHDISQWYQELAGKGAHFHYVSNKPPSLAASIREFIEVAELPPGSVHLHSFEFLEACIADSKKRKIRNITKLIKQFPESKFILVGNSSLKGLEAYTQLAKIHGGQILGVFIRNVYQGDPLLVHPTGESHIRNNTQGNVKAVLAPAIDPQQTQFPPTSTEKERKELQDRVNKARSKIPPDVRLRVFKHPSECNAYLPNNLRNIAPTAGGQTQVVPSRRASRTDLRSIFRPTL
ncbi:hypothetical protein AX16_003275 [Volvariella volvacea WC 439]|nr:hypothetical protein AX16_003275 [Volvariella volvacea WC 439]